MREIWRKGDFRVRSFKMGEICGWSPYIYYMGLVESPPCSSLHPTPVIVRVVGG